MSKIYAELLQEVNNNPNLNEEQRQILRANVNRLERQRLNVMITGGTGVGKSSTINAMFDADVAKVGIGNEPETMDIQRYDLGNLILWDTPGLGDGPEADERHAKNIVNKLNEYDSEGKALIDLVLVILDGGTRDYGTSFTLINEVIIPNLKDKTRILVAINKCDKLNPRNLADKVQSVRRRIFESTGVDIEPIYYSAGEKDAEDDEQRPYNLAKLLSFIIEHTPKNKRFIYVKHLSTEKDNWKDNDEDKNYKEEIIEKTKKSFLEQLGKGLMGALAGAAAGGEIGAKFFGLVGAKIGAIIGGIGGFLEGLFS